MCKKTLLIDADLRKPKLNEYLNVKAKAGLSDFLISEKKIYEFFNSIEGYPNLKYLSAGSKSTNSPKLIASDKFKKLIKNLKESQEFDCILINTTPVLGISESIILTPLVDRVIFVISIQNVPKDSAYESLKLLSKCINDEPLIISNCTKNFTNYDSVIEANYLNYYIN